MAKIPQRRILIVDDEPSVGKTVAMVLELDGHSVEVAGSGESAIALFQPGKFDLVITDYLMEGMNGGELAAALKARDPKQPIALMTAYAETLESSGNDSMGGVDYILHKPFMVGHLRQAITALARTGPA